MAVEQRISADDGWFVGEDKTLRFRTEGDVDGIAGWEFGFRLYGPRAKDADPPLLDVDSGIVGIAPTDTDPALVLVTISAEQSQTVGAGVFQFVLSRTDLGHRAVLSYGSAVIGSAVTG